MLEPILEFAKQAHEGQVRKYANEPYIRHPVRVMETCKQYGEPVPVLAAALLHDVLEDTEVTAAQMQTMLGSLLDEPQAAETMTYVIALTDEYVKKNYLQWNRRLRKAKELERLKTIPPRAQTIKYADILDNAASVATADPDFAGVLLREYRQILMDLDQGNPQLRSLVQSAVDEYIASLG